MTLPEIPAKPPIGPVEQVPANYLGIVEEDFLTTFRFKPGSLQSRLMKAIFRKPLLRLTEFLWELDAHLAHNNVHSMARVAVERLALGLSIHGEADITAEGPVLVVANHAGWIDIFVALAGINRPDVFVLAGAHPTLQHLPHFSEHILYVNQESVSSRAAAIRQIIAQLKAGHVVLIFPKGLLEPDPAIIPGAEQSINDWNDSVGIFLNKVPETILQPMLISQMVHPKAWKHWLIKLFKERRRRQQLAVALQFALSLRKKSGASWKTQPRIDFGDAVSAQDLSPALNPREISRGLKDRMLSLLAAVYPKQA